MSQLITKAYQDNSVNGLKERLANAQALRARNNANSADVSLFSLNTSDELAFGTMTSRFQSAAVLANTIALKGRNNANSSDLNLISLNTSDEILFGAQTSRFQASPVLPNNTALKARNNANSSDLSLFSLNTSDEILGGAQLLRLQSAVTLPNATFLKGRNQANSADVNIIELNSSNVAQMGVDLNMGGFQLLNVVNQVATFKAKALQSTNINTSNPGTAVFDGVTLTNGQYLLLTGQSTQTQNGLWIFNGSSSALTRPTGWTTGVTVAESTVVLIDFGGTTYGNQIWTVQDDSVVGTDNIVLHAASSSGGSFANTALSNLASTAINADLVPDTDVTYNLGHTALGWSGANIAVLYDNVSGPITAIDVYNRQLRNAANSIVFDWSGSVLEPFVDIVPDTNVSRNLGSSSVFFANIFVSQMLDASSVFIFDVLNRRFVDDANTEAIKFTSANRWLKNAAGTVMLDFTSGFTTGTDILSNNANTASIGSLGNPYLGMWASTFNVVDFTDGFKAVVGVPTLGADTNFTLPPDNGTAGYVLRTDGAGVTTWVPATGMTGNKETFTLSGTDITNQYIDLGHVAITNSIHFIVQGLGPLLEGASYDYTVNYTGGSGGHTRITFQNDIATGGGSALVSGDKVQVVYWY